MGAPIIMGAIRVATKDAKFQGAQFKEKLLFIKMPTQALT